MSKKNPKKRKASYSPLKESSIPKQIQAIYSPPSFTGVFTWNSVGWYVATGITLWGTFHGTGLSGAAAIFVTLTGGIILIKFAHSVMMPAQQLRRGYAVLGSVVVGVCTFYAAKWTLKHRVVPLDPSPAILSALTETQMMQTGGDSYVILIPNVLTEDLAIPVVKAEGRYPLHGVRMSMAYMGSYGYVSLNQTVGDMYVGEAEQRPEYSFKVAGHQRMLFRIHFQALNGSWSEELMLAKVGGKWRQAYQISREDSEGKQWRIINEYSDADFPKNSEKKIDWQQFQTPNASELEADRKLGIPFLKINSFR